MVTREQRASSRWERLFAIKVHMESGFRLTPYNEHLRPEVRMRRWVGTQSKHFQIRYAEVNRKLAQAQTIIDADYTEWFDSMFPFPDFDAVVSLEDI